MKTKRESLEQSKQGVEEDEEGNREWYGDLKSGGWDIYKEIVGQVTPFLVRKEKFSLSFFLAFEL